MNTTSFSAFFDEMNKIAEEKKEEQYEHPALTIAKGLGGYALGSGLGYVGMHGLDKGLKALGGKGISRNVILIGGPLVGAGGAAGFKYLQNKFVDSVKGHMERKNQDANIAEGSRV